MSWHSLKAANQSALWLETDGGGENHSSTFKCLEFKIHPLPKECRLFALKRKPFRKQKKVLMNFLSTSSFSIGKKRWQFNFPYKHLLLKTISTVCQTFWFLPVYQKSKHGMIEMVCHKCSARCYYSEQTDVCFPAVGSWLSNHPMKVQEYVQGRSCQRKHKAFSLGRSQIALHWKGCNASSTQSRPIENSGYWRHLNNCHCTIGNQKVAVSFNIYFLFWVSIKVLVLCQEILPILKKKIY